ncbi:MAG: PleD family two-component system response regulator [Micavibrio sp.]|nr:PleD family two-component system response regulator [Micavibrio sp.]
MSARVLVVDDILPNVKLLEAKLSSEYYEVITALSGEEALKKIASDGPDIVLLDVMMPGMDGFEVCKRIKADSRMAHIPVVMVTALTDATDRVKGLEAGADDFLSKPVNDTALMARVRSLVRLKMTVDEWRIRENTATALGVTDEKAEDEKVDSAKILVVEDQAFESDKFVETLQRDHHDVTAVEDGIKAMEAVGKKDFDIIMISLNMLEEDGLRLVSHLKSNEKTRAVPILMVGNEEDMHRIAHGLEIGAHDYIIRPVDRNELLARARTQIRRKRFQERLRANYEVSLNMALTDTLTGLYNRRYLTVHLEKLLRRNEESHKSITVLLFDIDYFKKVNDTYGHNVGDEVLKEFAERLNQGLRSFDLVARLGGEEFVAILPDVTKERAMTISERLRRMIADKPFAITHDEFKEITCTTSIGATYIFDETNITTEEALKRADDMLYKAKADGRNCCYFEGEGKVDPVQFEPAERPKE